MTVNDLMKILNDVPCTARLYTSDPEAVGSSLRLRMQLCIMTKYSIKLGLSL